MPKNDAEKDRQINPPWVAPGSVFEPAGGLGGLVKFRIVTGKTKRNLKTPCTRRGAAEIDTGASQGRLIVHFWWFLTDVEKSSFFHNLFPGDVTQKLKICVFVEMP